MNKDRYIVEMKSHYDWEMSCLEEQLEETQAQLDEARAHVDTLVKGWVGGEDYPCQYCGHRYNHSKDCVYEAARKWLEAQVQDDPVPDIHTDTDWCECSVCKAEAQDYG